MGDIVRLYSKNPETAKNRLANLLSAKIPIRYSTIIEAMIPIQIAYFTGLRLGEVCGLTWQDINLEEQYLTVRRSIRYNGARHKTEIGPTKRKKVRIVDFGDTLTEMLPS